MTAHGTATRHRHEALLYRDTDEFVRHGTRFLREGVERDEAVLVASSPSRYALLREALDDLGAQVGFLDMASVGRNPGRLISQWHDFVTGHAGRPVRGIGEPVSAERTPDEIAECETSEALWNLVFDPFDVWVVCPYDVSALDEGVLASVRRTHPVLVAGGEPVTSTDYAVRADQLLHRPLREPERVDLAFAFDLVQPVREAVRGCAQVAGLTPSRVEEFVLAVSEAAGNSLRHGGGSGRLRLWTTDRDVVCEIRDSGRVTDPLIGRLRPDPHGVEGRGLWIANQICDLLQIRSDEHGATVRLHMRRTG